MQGRLMGAPPTLYVSRMRHSQTKGPSVCVLSQLPEFLELEQLAGPLQPGQQVHEPWKSVVDLLEEARGTERDMSKVITIGTGGTHPILRERAVRILRASLRFWQRFLALGLRRLHAL